MAELGNLGATITANAQGFLAELTKSEKGLSAFEKSISKSVQRAGTGLVGLTVIARQISNQFKQVYKDIENIPGVPGHVVASVVEMRTQMEEWKNATDRLTAGIIGGFAQAGKSIGLFGGAVAQAATGFRRRDFSNIYTLGSAIKRQFNVATEAVTTALDDEYQAADRAAKAQNKLANETIRAKAAAKEQAEELTRVNAALDAFFGEIDKQSTSTFEGMLNNLKASLETTKEIVGKTKKLGMGGTDADPTAPDSFARRGLLVGSADASASRTVTLLQKQAALLEDIARNTATPSPAVFA
jgi:hypothetical protein